MIIDYQNKIVFLSNTKVASSTMEFVIKENGKRIGSLSGASRLKHLNFSQFLKICDGLNVSAFETICAIRHPLDKARSWYKYRSRPDIKNQKNKISGKSFGEFLLECIEQKDQPNDLFGICDSSFVTDMETGRMVDVIYKYDNIEALWKFLGDLYGEDIEVPIKNASPVIELGEYEEHLAQFREAFADEIFWYENVQEGHQKSPC